MRFRDHTTPPLPQIDLIPMLTVMMGILGFFVVVTMTLGNEQQVELQLPSASSEADPPPDQAPPFIIELNASGDIRLNNQPIDQATLEARMQTYLDRRPDQPIYLLPSRDLPYEAVMQFLGEMREIGGDRVSLAIEE